MGLSAEVLSCQTTTDSEKRTTNERRLSSLMSVKWREVGCLMVRHQRRLGPAILNIPRVLAVRFDASCHAQTFAP